MKAYPTLTKRKSLVVHQPYNPQAKFFDLQKQAKLISGDKKALKTLIKGEFNKDPTAEDQFNMSASLPEDVHYEDSEEDELMHLYADLIHDDQTLMSRLHRNFRAKILEKLEEKREEQRDFVFLNYGTGI